MVLPFSRTLALELTPSNWSQTCCEAASNAGAAKAVL